MRRTVLWVVVVGLSVAGCGMVGDSEPQFATFSATIVYENPATFAVDEASQSEGSGACLPGVSKDGAIDHGSLTVTGFSGIWSTPPIATFPLADGILVDGTCVVAVEFPVEDGPFQDVQLGCSSWVLDGNNVTADGDWNAGTLEYVGCLDRIATPDDWPPDLLAASMQLRADTKDALAAAGFRSDRIEASPTAQSHPVTLTTCASGGVQDTDRDLFRFEESDIENLAEYWGQAGYEVTATAFVQDGPNDQRRLRAGKDGVGTILVSWRTIGPNGDPFIVEIFSPCFEPSFTPPS